MANSIQIDAATGVAYVRVTGIDDVESAMKRVLEVTSCAGWRPGFDLVVDYTDAETIRCDATDVLRVVGMHEQLHVLLGDGRIVIVDPRADTAPLHELFRASLELKSLHEVHVVPRSGDAERRLSFPAAG